MAKKVIVSGCFDLLHSGHVEFFRQASAYGDLYVALGSDQNIYELKGRVPVNPEQERLFLVESIRYVHRAFISAGSGILDFEAEMRQIQPDFMVVNHDGDAPEKRQLCAALGVEYVVLQREPHTGLPGRSTTALRGQPQMPFRIDLAGGWLDQPWVSQHHPGPVITISLEPTHAFNERSGMASSTRHSAIDLWGVKVPPDDYEKLAKILFCYDNPPGTRTVSGSQDSIGIVFPGLAYAYYQGEYWPSYFKHVLEEDALQFVESAMHLVELGPREAAFDVLADTKIDPPGAKALADAAEGCWQAILDRDLVRFGRYFRESFEAQVAMFPHMMTDQVAELIERYRERALGWKLSGAGGGGYLILITDEPVQGAIQVRARRGRS